MGYDGPHIHGTRSHWAALTLCQQISCPKWTIFDIQTATTWYFKVAANFCNPDFVIRTLISLRLCKLVELHFRSIGPSGVEWRSHLTSWVLIPLSFKSSCNFLETEKITNKRLQFDKSVHERTQQKLDTYPVLCYKVLLTFEVSLQQPHWRSLYSQSERERERSLDFRNIQTRLFPVGSTELDGIYLE